MFINSVEGSSVKEIFTVFQIVFNEKILLYNISCEIAEMNLLLKNFKNDAAQKLGQLSQQSPADTLQKWRQLQKSKLRTTTENVQEHFHHILKRQTIELKIEFEIILKLLPLNNVCQTKL